MNIEASHIFFFHTINKLFSDAQLYTIKTKAKTKIICIWFNIIKIIIYT